MKGFEKRCNKYKNIKFVFDNMSETQRNMEAFEGIPHMLPFLCNDVIRVKVIGSIKTYDQHVYVLQKLSEHVKGLSCKACKIILEVKTKGGIRPEGLFMESEDTFSLQEEFLDKHKIVKEIVLKEY